MKASSVLRLAMAELARRGLWQGWYMPCAEKNETMDPAEDVNPQTCKVCMAGAVSLVVNGHPVPGHAPVADMVGFGALDILQTVTDNDLRGFNDAPERTLKDCLEAFGYAIAIAEKRESDSSILPWRP